MRLTLLILLTLFLFVFSQEKVQAVSVSERICLKVENGVWFRDLFSELEKDFLAVKEEKGIDSALVILNEIEITAKKEFKGENYEFSSRIYTLLGIFYSTVLKEYEKAVDCWHESNEIHSYIPDKKLEQKIENLEWLAKSFYNLKSYKKAIEYSREAVLINEQSDSLYSTSDVLNTVGLCFEKLGQLDSSYYYYHLALKNNPNDKNTIWEGIVKGNIGYNYYLEGRYREAIPLMKFCIMWAYRWPDYRLAAGSLTPLAHTYLLLGELDSCKEFLRLSKECLDKELFSNRFLNYLKVATEYYLVIGDKGNAISCLDSLNHYQEIAAQDFSLEILLRIQQRQEIEARKKAFAQVESDKKIKTLQRNYLFITISVMFLLFLYYLRLQRKKHAAEQKLKENTIQNKNEALIRAQDQLTEFSKNISEKTTLIEEFQEKLDEKQEHKDSVLSQIRENTILTEKQWTNFQKLFDEVHPGFLYGLKEKYSSLSQAELRYLALAKMNLSNKEMAAMQGISTQTVRVTLHRLRKKLKITEDMELSSLLENL